jgi:hypothetical protein
LPMQIILPCSFSDISLISLLAQAVHSSSNCLISYQFTLSLDPSLLMYLISSLSPVHSQLLVCFFTDSLPPICSETATHFS